MVFFSLFFLEQNNLISSTFPQRLNLLNFSFLFFFLPYFSHFCMSVLKGETEYCIHVLAEGSKIPGKTKQCPSFVLDTKFQLRHLKLISAPFFSLLLLTALHFVHIFHISSLQYATTTRSGIADQLSGQIVSVI